MAPAAVLGYLINQGVRRSVAAREAGKTDIPAVIVENGKPDVFTRLPLSVLISRKSSVPRDTRYIRDVEYPTAVLGTEPPPIEVQPIRNPRVLAVFTPLARVTLM